MSLPKVSEFVRPTDLAAALHELEAVGARIVAGGIDVVLFPGDTTKLVDISGLPLSGINSDAEGIVIGATTTMTALIESPLISDYLNGVVTTMLHHLASPLQRNLATIGGTLMSAHPWSDVIPLFLVLGARITYYDGTEHTVPIAQFYAESIFRQRMIVTAVRLPAFPRETAAAFIKFSRTAFDIAILNCAALVQITTGRCTVARIAIGGAPQRGYLLPHASAVLIESGTLTAETIANAAKTARDEADVGDDMRASAAYRRNLVEVGVQRALSQIKDKLEAGV